MQRAGRWRRGNGTNHAKYAGANDMDMSSARGGAAEAAPNEAGGQVSATSRALQKTRCVVSGAILPDAEQRFALPLPPSLANSFATIPGQGRVQSAIFRRWLEEAGATLEAQQRRGWGGPVSLRLEVNPPGGRIFDIEARRAAVLKLLVAHGIIRPAEIRAHRRLPLCLVPSGAPLTVVIAPK